MILQIRQRSLYPALYRWLLALAALDVLVTSLVLALGGTEANALAAAVIDRAGVPGMVALKVFSIGAVIGVCEYVGRRRPSAGHRLAQAALAANTAAVTVGCLFLGEYAVAVAVG
jgi:hypothetical protein